MTSRLCMLLSGLIVAAALAACGGGGGGGGDSTPTNNATQGGAVEITGMPSTTTMTTPTITNLSVSGDLLYTRFTNNTFSTPESITLTVNASTASENRALAYFSAPFNVFEIASTEDDWANITWGVVASGGGSLFADGNLMQICPATAALTGMYISANMQRVTDYGEIAGKTYSFRSCDGQPSDPNDTITFLPDGTGTDNIGTLFGAAAINAYFNASGFQSGNDRYTGRVYKHVVEGQPAQYFLLESAIENGVTRLSLYVAE
jgi:hypothetical protein